MQARQYLVRAVLLAGIACAMLWPALWNRGPFFTEDTRTYIRSADAAVNKATHWTTAWTAPPESPSNATGGTPQESFLALHNQAESRTRSLSEISKKGVLLGRSPFYGLLLYLGAITGGFWLSMLLQSGAVLLAVYLTLRTLQLPVWPNLAYLGLGLCLVPAAPFFTSYLMPDLFAGIAILACAALLSTKNRIALGDLFLWFLLLAAAVLFHDSCVLIVALLFCVALVVNLVRRNWANERGMAVILLALFTAYAGQALVVYGVKRATGEAPLRLPFLSAHLIADGPGTNYLRATCPGSNFTLCQDVSEFPLTDSEFLFGAQPGHSVFEVAPYEKRRAISQEQFRFFLSVLRYDPAGVLKTAAQASFMQLFDFILSDFQYDPGMRDIFDRTLPLPVLAGMHETAAYRGAMPLGALSVFLYGLVFGSVAYLCFALWAAREKMPLRGELKPFIAWIGTGILVNAAVCGAISGIFPRYQCRVIWLIPLAALLFFLSRSNTSPGTSTGAASAPADSQQA